MIIEFEGEVFRWDARDDASWFFAAVPPERATACVAALREAALDAASVGVIEAADPARPLITLVAR